MASFQGSPPTTYSVSPVEAEVVAWDVSEVAVLRVEVENLDLSQSVSCRLRSRCWTGIGYSMSERAELLDIAPGATGGLDVSCGGATSLSLLGVSSGVGCDIKVASRRSIGR